MSRNLGAKNPLRQVLQVSFFDPRNSAKVTIFIVLMSLLLSVALADKEPHQDDDIIKSHVTELPQLMVSENLQNVRNKFPFVFPPDNFDHVDKLCFP